MNSSTPTPCPSSLADLSAAPDYSSRVMGITGQLAQADDEAKAVVVLSAAAGAMGFDAAAFVSFLRDDPSLETFRFMLACDPLWCLKYEREASYLADPWLGYALKHTEPARGEDIPATSQRQRAVSKLAMQYGFASSLIVPAPCSGAVTRLGVLCLGSTQPGFVVDAGFMPLKVLARGLAMDLHEWWIARLRLELIEYAELTDEDIALLAHERMGLGTKHIAMRLATSPHSINSRFYRMNARLGVPNRKAAAQLAAEYNVI